METAMQMQKEIEALSRMTVGQLRQKYLEVFGEESRSNHKHFLFWRITWRIQVLARRRPLRARPPPRAGDRVRCRSAHPGAPDQVRAGSHAESEVERQGAAQFVAGQVVTPEFVRSQWSSAAAGSNGRLQNSAAIQQPGLVIA